MTLCYMFLLYTEKTEYCTVSQRIKMLICVSKWKSNENKNKENSSKESFYFAQKEDEKKNM